jgi:hypothetical protein
MKPTSYSANLSSCLALLPLLLAAGCFTPRIPHELVLGPGYHPANIYGQKDPLPAQLRRVAVLPLSGGPAVAERELLGAALESELAKTGSFELVRVSADELEVWTGQRAWPATAALPVPLETHLRDQLGCDGFLLPEVTQYRAYPPLALGWNLKLVDLHSGKIIWAADEMFDAGQTEVANSARRYRLRHSQVPGAVEDSRFVLLSPDAFCHYTAEALFETLPVRPLPTPAKVSRPPADKNAKDRKAI